MSAAGDAGTSGASKLAQTIRNGPLPTVLDNLVKESEKIPRWVADPASSRYTYSNPAFQRLIQQLNEAFPLDYDHYSEDAELIKDVSYMIDVIFRVCKRSWELNELLPAPTESDRRTPLDYLMSCTWDDDKTESFQHREETPLQLVETLSSTRFPTKVHPDSSVFIRLKDWKLTYRFPAFSNACSAMLREDSEDGHLRALHWVSEYKNHKRSRKVALQQAMIAVTPGLYQRRALGFQSHFLFMTVHCPLNHLEVYAATWGPTQAVASANTGAAAPFWRTSGHSTGPTRQDNTGVIGMTAGPSNPTPPLINPDQSSTENQSIIFYHLRDFNIRSSNEVLQYYLLMQATMSLAQMYRRAIDKESEAKLATQVRGSAQYYMWPATQPPPRSNTSMQSIQTLSMGPPQPQPQLQDNSLHKQPLHEPNMQATEVDNDGSLIFRQVEELGSVYPNIKVRNYLLNLRPDIYKPLPDVQINYD